MLGLFGWNYFEKIRRCEFVGRHVPLGGGHAWCVCVCACVYSAVCVKSREQLSGTGSPSLDEAGFLIVLLLSVFQCDWLVSFRAVLCSQPPAGFGGAEIIYVRHFQLIVLLGCTLGH